MAQSPPDVGLDHARAVLAGAVVIVVAREPVPFGGCDELFGQRMSHALVRHMHGPLVAPPGIAAAVPGFQAPEIRQDPGIVPAHAAGLGPVIEVERVAAHEHHAVDGAAAAEGTAGGPDFLHPVAGGVRFAPVKPVEFFRTEQQAGGNGQVG